MSKERVNDLRERGEWTLGPKNPSRGKSGKFGGRTQATQILIPEIAQHTRPLISGW